MCGIFAYIGNKSNAAEIVSNGLKRLDYRGYDSWGIAVQTESGIVVEKKAGKISDIKHFNSLPQSSMAIAHTRWATTGGVTDVNAHPHYSTDKSFALAQNGIVENYEELRDSLKEKGYSFISETDTEVIVRLIEEKKKTAKNLKDAVSLAFQELEGRNTIILITHDKQIIAARNGSPLVIGFNTQTGEIFLSSDTLSFSTEATKMVVMDNGQMAYFNNVLKLYDIKSGEELQYEPIDIGFTNTKVDK